MLREKHKVLEDMPAKDMLKNIREKAALLEIDSKFLSRSLNEGFSGGEKKAQRNFSNGHVGAKTGNFRRDRFWFGYRCP